MYSREVEGVRLALPAACPTPEHGVDANGVVGARATPPNGITRTGSPERLRQENLRGGVGDLIRGKQQ